MTKLTKKQLSNRLKHTAANYDVGYAKPPASGKFQNGKSGNPKGANLARSEDLVERQTETSSN